MEANIVLRVSVIFTLNCFVNVKEIYVVVSIHQKIKVDN